VETSLQTATIVLVSTVTILIVATTAGLVAATHVLAIVALTSPIMMLAMLDHPRSASVGPKPAQC